MKVREDIMGVFACYTSMVWIQSVSEDYEDYAEVQIDVIL